MSSPTALPISVNGDLGLPAAQIKCFHAILDFSCYFILHSSYQPILLAPPSKYVRNPGTCHHFLCYHLGLSHHDLLPSSLCESPCFPSHPAPPPQTPSLLFPPLLFLINTATQVTVKYESDHTPLLNTLQWPLGPHLPLLPYCLL